MKNMKISQSITPRETESIRRYFSELSSSIPLTSEQEVALAKKIQKGDIEARNELVTANLRFVITVAKQYQYADADFEDLVNEGNIGLIRAAETFDPNRGVKFTTHSVWRIQESIMKFLEDKARMIRMPQNAMLELNRVRNFAAQYEQEHHHAPSMGEMAEHLDVTEERLAEILYGVTSTVSLDAPCASDTDTTVGDMMADSWVKSTDHGLMLESLRHDVQVALNGVSPREQDILRLYFGMDGEPMSMDTIAMTLHLTRERVRQLMTKAIGTLRRRYGQSLRQYV